MSYPHLSWSPDFASSIQQLPCRWVGRRMESLAAAAATKAVAAVFHEVGKPLELQEVRCWMEQRGNFSTIFYHFLPFFYHFLQFSTQDSGIDDSYLLGWALEIGWEMDETAWNWMPCLENHQDLPGKLRLVAFECSSRLWVLQLFGRHGGSSYMWWHIVWWFWTWILSVLRLAWCCSMVGSVSQNNPKPGLLAFPTQVLFALYLTVWIDSLKWWSYYSLLQNMSPLENSGLDSVYWWHPVPPDSFARQAERGWVARSDGGNVPSAGAEQKRNIGF